MIAAPPAVRRRVIAIFAVAGVFGVACVLAPTAVAKTTLPYQDPNASGYVGLCDKSGQAVTSGQLAAEPFVWNAVSSVAASKPYNVTGATATLYAYQPRPNVPAAEWSGEQLTGPARYSDPKYPKTAATAADLSLLDFVQSYPPLLDGLIQLRIYLGAPNAPTKTTAYAAADIQVTGGAWKVVDGGAFTNADCGHGTAVAVESLLLPSSALTAGPTPTNTSVPSTAETGLSTAADSRPTNHTWQYVLGALVLLAVAGGGYRFGRRRRTDP